MDRYVRRVAAKRTWWNAAAGFGGLEETTQAPATLAGVADRPV